MKRYCLLTIMMILLACSAVLSQTLQPGTDVLQWNTDQLYDSAANVNQSLTCQFITYGSTKIDWIQKDNYTNTFTVTSSSGNWADASTDGLKDFYVKYGTRKGRLRIQRSGGVMQVSMYFIENNKNTMPYTFHVSAVSKKP